MIIPVGDMNPRRTVPFINYLLILANVAAYVWVYFLHPPEQVESVVISNALKPDQWMDLKTIFTSMFIHAQPPYFDHLFFNMLFLWIAGDNVEDRLGHLPYLFFYFLAGVAASAAHVAMALTVMPSMAGTPTVGASGAISGVIGAYLVLFPGSKIKFILWLIIFIRRFTLPSWAVIGFWVASQVFMARDQMDGVRGNENATVAVFAHLGGFAFGLAVAILLRMFGRKPVRKPQD